MRPLPRVRLVISFQAARSRLARFTTGSFAAHGALLALIVIVPSTRQRVAPIDDTMVVQLSGPIASPPPRGGAVAPEAARAEPTPPPAPKEAHTVPEIPAQKPKEKSIKPKKEPAKPKETPSPAAPAAPAPAPASAATPHDLPPGTSAGSASGAVTAMVGGGDTALGWYGAAVKAALESAWIKPYLEDASGTVSVVVAFDIARDGTTRNLRIAVSSGIPSLDRSAQRAVIEASPLPAVPPAWTEPTIPVTMRFDLSPESR